MLNWLISLFYSNKSKLSFLKIKLILLLFFKIYEKYFFYIWFINILINKKYDIKILILYEILKYIFFISMSYKLVIVEFLNKVEIIKKYFGENYNVMVLVGYIVRLSKKGLMGLGIDMSKWEFEFEIDLVKKEIVK